MRKNNVGSSLDSWLREERIHDEVLRQPSSAFFGFNPAAR